MDRGRSFRGPAQQPQLGAAFAGKIDYRKYKSVDRFMIRFIMWLTDGPTDPSTAVEFTDWTKVEAFATEVAALEAPLSNA